MIVEDEIKVYQWLADCLEGDTFDLVWTQTAHEGRRRSLDEWFDLVLLDSNLPDGDGWKTLDWFNKLHPFLPVVMLTEESDPPQRATALGADACLEKPLDVARLLETVNQLLAESHSARMTRLSEALSGQGSMRG